MLDTNSYFAERLMDLRVQEERHQGELRRLEREARRAHRGLLPLQNFWLLGQLGSLFASLWMRLRQANLPHRHSAREQMLLE